ncbi:MAG TPA: hypothetical protein VL992_06210 [Tepidisphaeraceae bacterium]|nr:hypothetical protein [Tepidisphaeraceae bacterium]
MTQWLAAFGALFLSTSFLFISHGTFNLWGEILLFTGMGTLIVSSFSLMIDMVCGRYPRRNISQMDRVG